MKSFKQYLQEQELDEVAIQFGGKAYPKFGQIVILAGGAGSGKGFVKKNLILIDGKVFDTDAIKNLAIASTVFAEKVKAETGTDLKQINLKNPDNVYTIHTILKNMYRLDTRFQNLAFKSILESHPDRKPNLIFDMTLKDLVSLKTISHAVNEIGYQRENIHIVWIVNSIDVAVEQNTNRERVVSQEVLLTTHEGSALTMKKLLTMGNQLQSYMDGNIYIVFNRFGVDSKTKKSRHGGQYVEQQQYLLVKERGQPTNQSAITTEINNKIADYVPKTTIWKRTD